MRGCQEFVEESRTRASAEPSLAGAVPRSPQDGHPTL